MSTERATNWSLTINNPGPDDEEAINLARQKGWKVTGQLEVGAEGTPHYQLHVQTPQVRFSAVKKQFPRAHIEVARNVPALATYVTKEETRIGQLPSAQEKYPSLTRLWELIYDELTERPPRPRDKWFPGTSVSYDANHALPLFDEVIRSLIRQGYIVEPLAVNPGIRAQWSRFHSAILDRISLTRQDRQTDTRLAAAVDIPTIEHNHANLPPQVDPSSP